MPVLHSLRAKAHRRWRVFGASFLSEEFLETMGLRIICRGEIVEVVIEGNRGGSCNRYCWMVN